jgi:hypothetical protein
MIAAIDAQLAPLERELRQLARRQAGCRALMAHYGIGELTAPTILCELGDVTRLSASRKAVRCAGLDVGVHRSDRRSRAGKLTKQGSPQLRWVLYESAPSIASANPTNPRWPSTFRPAPAASATPAHGGDRPKTARPESLPADRPINHHVTGRWAVDPDKPGRPRSDRIHASPQITRPRTSGMPGFR